MDSRAGRCGRGAAARFPWRRAAAREQGARALVLRDGTGDMGLQRWQGPWDSNGPTLRFAPPADPGVGIFVLEVGLRGPRPL